MTCVVLRVPLTVPLRPLRYLTWENACYYIFEVGGRRPAASHATLTTEVMYFRFCSWRPVFNMSRVLLFVLKNVLTWVDVTIGGQFSERLLLWQPSGIFLYSTVIILICFMLCWRIKYDDDDGSRWWRWKRLWQRIRSNLLTSVRTFLHQILQLPAN